MFLAPDASAHAGAHPIGKLSAMQIARMPRGYRSSFRNQIPKCNEAKREVASSSNR